jgi:hypothetical protein
MVSGAALPFAYLVIARESVRGVGQLTCNVGAVHPPPVSGSGLLFDSTGDRR